MSRWKKFLGAVLSLVAVVLAARRADAYPGSNHVNGTAFNFWPTSGLVGAGTCGGCHVGSSPTLSLQQGSGSFFNVLSGNPTFNVTPGSTTTFTISLGAVSNQW